MSILWLIVIYIQLYNEIPGNKTSKLQARKGRVYIYYIHSPTASKKTDFLLCNAKQSEEL